MILHGIFHDISCIPSLSDAFLAVKWPSALHKRPPPSTAKLLPRWPRPGHAPPEDDAIGDET